MRELIRYLKDYKKESVIGPLFKMLEACFELAVPLVMAGIIDVGIRNQDSGYVWGMCVLLIALGLLGLVCSLTAQFFAAKAAMGFGTALRRDMFAHINKLSYAELDAIGASGLVTRITNDVNQAQAGVNLVLRLFLRSPFLVAGAVVMAFTINVKTTAIFLAAVPIISLVIYLIIRLTIPIFKKAQNLLDRLALLTRENHVGVRVVRAFSKQKKELEDFDETNLLLTKTQILSGKISALMNPLTYAVLSVAIIAILWTGGYEVSEGVITQGELTALINYMSQILLALLALANLIIAFTKAVASAARINEVFSTKPSITGAERPIENPPSEIAVEFDRVSFSYSKTAANSLEKISFRAEKGQIIGIIGGTGSGKTTLVNLIPRFYDAGEGTVLISGAPVKSYQLSQLRGKIGVAPQNAVLFKGTLRENMRWGKPDATDDEIRAALTTSQALDILSGKPEGLDFMILQGGRNLSGGQRQRLTIARALVSRPEILILDDSSSALDYATDAALRRALKENTRGMTVFIVSQRASSIRNADKILVLDDGRLAGIGAHAELIETCPVYREICLSQTAAEKGAARE